MAVSETHIDTLVVGGGQAGVAMSEHLSNQGVPHLVLERHRIAERWRTQRWDSLVANGPAWHDRFPGLEFEGLDPDDFASKDQVAAYLEAYARKVRAAIRTDVEMRKVERNQGRPGFTVETSQGVIQVNRVVVATGSFQRPVIPACSRGPRPEAAPLCLSSVIQKYSDTVIEFSPPSTLRRERHDDGEGRFQAHTASRSFTCGDSHGASGALGRDPPHGGPGVGIDCGAGAALRGGVGGQLK